jgi:hypothetical protein
MAEIFEIMALLLFKCSLNKIQVQTECSPRLKRMVSHEQVSILSMTKGLTVSYIL